MIFEHLGLQYGRYSPSCWDVHCLHAIDEHCSLLILTTALWLHLLRSLWVLTPQAMQDATHYLLGCSENNNSIIPNLKPAPLGSRPHLVPYLFLKPSMELLQPTLRMLSLYISSPFPASCLRLNSSLPPNNLAAGGVRAFSSAALIIWNTPCAVVVIMHVNIGAQLNTLVRHFLLKTWSNKHPKRSLGPTWWHQGTMCN